MNTLKLKITYLCAICNNHSEKPVCDNCEKLLKLGYISKGKNRYYINTGLILKKLDEKANFYDPQKQYRVKTAFLTKHERVLYETLKMKLEEEYIILPQVNLQTIIETNSIHRNNELFRNIDFCIFEKETLRPLLAIELNGNSHNTTFWEKRDFSVKSILEKANLPLITLENEDLERKNTIEIFTIIKQKLDKIKLGA